LGYFFALIIDGSGMSNIDTKEYDLALGDTTVKLLLKVAIQVESILSMCIKMK
jgi:hypothetical protein